MGFWSLKNPPPTPGISQTWFEPLRLTARLDGPPEGDGTIAVATGPIPCCVAVFRLSRGARHEREAAVGRRLIEEDGDVVGTLVGDYQVEAGR